MPLPSLCDFECQSSCEKNCQTTCQRSCQSYCQRSCQSSCLSSCQSTCQKACQSTCEKACQSTCEKSCQSSCEKGCQNYCERNCQSTCERSCQSTCEKSCQSSCEKSCQCSAEGCQSSCEKSCQCSAEGCQSCQSYCERNCQSSCQTSCQDTCERSCQSTCQNSCQCANQGCQSSCEKNCMDTCQINCQTGCLVSCQITCEKACQTACEKGCQSACEKACQSSCEATCQVLCEICETPCEGACQGCQTTCEKACQGCESTCQKACQEKCETACQTECELSCQSICLNCETPCEAGCQFSAEGCQTTCESSCQCSNQGCQTTCESACQCSNQGCQSCQDSCECSVEGCQDSCQSICENSCQTVCENGCQDACELSCQCSNQNDQSCQCSTQNNQGCQCLTENNQGGCNIIQRPDKVEKTIWTDKGVKGIGYVIDGKTYLTDGTRLPKGYIVFTDPKYYKMGDNYVGTEIVFKASLFELSNGAYINSDFCHSDIRSELEFGHLTKERLNYLLTIVEFEGFADLKSSIEAKIVAMDNQAKLDELTAFVEAATTISELESLLEQAETYGFSNLVNVIKNKILIINRTEKFNELSMAIESAVTISRLRELLLEANELNFDNLIIEINEKIDDIVAKDTIELQKGLVYLGYLNHYDVDFGVIDSNTINAKMDFLKKHCIRDVMVNAGKKISFTKKLSDIAPIIAETAFLGPLTEEELIKKYIEHLKKCGYLSESCTDVTWTANCIKAMNKLEEDYGLVKSIAFDDVNKTYIEELIKLYPNGVRWKIHETKIAEYQQKLIDAEYASGDNFVDGYMGDITKSALNTFQKSKGLTETKFFDKETIDVLDELIYGLNEEGWIFDFLKVTNYIPEDQEVRALTLNDFMQFIIDIIREESELTAEIKEESEKKRGKLENATMSAEENNSYFELEFESGVNYSKYHLYVENFQEYISSWANVNRIAINNKIENGEDQYTFVPDGSFGDKCRHAIKVYENHMNYKEVGMMTYQRYHELFDYWINNWFMKGKVVDKSIALNTGSDNEKNDYLSKWKWRFENWRSPFAGSPITTFKKECSSSFDSYRNWKGNNMGRLHGGVDFRSYRTLPGRAIYAVSQGDIADAYCSNPNLMEKSQSIARFSYANLDAGNIDLIADDGTLIAYCEIELNEDNLYIDGNNVTKKIAAIKDPEKPIGWTCKLKSINTHEMLHLMMFSDTSKSGNLFYSGTKTSDYVNVIPTHFDGSLTSYMRREDLLDPTFMKYLNYRKHEVKPSGRNSVSEPDVSNGDLNIDYYCESNVQQ